MKNIPFLLGFLIVIVFVGAITLSLKNKDQVPPFDSNYVATTTATSTNNGGDVVPKDADAMIVVENPKSGQVLKNGFILKGKARGNWYFEASFPAKIVDSNGKILAQFPVSANGEWMTTEFVPFSQTITFATSSTPTGLLILERDNPSGLPQYDMQLVIPIKFSTSTSVQMTTKPLRS